MRRCCCRRQGYRPIVLERGPALDERVKAVEHFSATGELDENANIQFGEGGAGTFSDGKLTTRIGDELCGFVTEVFLEHGALKETAWQQKPHAGTDLLRASSLRIRKRDSSRWAREVHFNTAPSPASSGGRPASSASSTTDGALPLWRRWCSRWATGPRHLRDADGQRPRSWMRKPFSVGFRAEHLQSEIEKSSTTRRRAIRPAARRISAFAAR
ncbi:MAG: hypothetical protein ACLVJH_15155 [Faecalibacterium prausnitzii]